MAFRQPKKHIQPIKYSEKPFGNEVRKSYQKTILEKAPIFPKPLEYEDIDNAFFDFVKNEIDVTVNGEVVPTFTLFSSQRFSEYSQTWNHSDEEGNLLMNFKTVNRDSNPSFGDNQGGLWNIPGNRRYTILQRTVLDDNGTESYEKYSMKQPYTVDLAYRINFVTNVFENINTFNQKVNYLFKARQCYIRPNGHYIPMVIDEINDESTYSIEDRKFYVQSISVKVMAYIIHETDFEIEKTPKRIFLAMEGETTKKPKISIDEYDTDKFEYTSIDMTVEFQPFMDKAKFESDTDFVVEKVESKNVRSLRLFKNGTMVYYKDGFKIKNGDEIKIKLFLLEINKPSVVYLHGYNPNKTYNSEETPEFVYDEKEKHEDIKIE